VNEREIEILRGKERQGDAEMEDPISGSLSVGRRRWNQTTATTATRFPMARSRFPAS
jgi:hypothetical protein